MISGKEEFWIVSSEQTLERFLEKARELYADSGYVEFEWKTAKTRTQKQNRALHVWLRWISEELNSAGFTVHEFFKADHEMIWTPTIVKENIWRPVMRSMTGKDSSVRLSRKEVSQIFDVLNNALARKGVHVPWPQHERSD